MSYDVVQNPSHYAEGRKYEPKDVIRDWGLNFNLGSTVKYIARAGKKDDIVQDLKKAKRFLEFEIEALEAEKKGTRPVFDEDVNEDPKEESKNLCDSCVYTNLALCPSFSYDVKLSGDGVISCKHYREHGEENLWKAIMELFEGKEARGHENH